MGPTGLPEHVLRIERIEQACATPLGFAMRGVTSWEQDWMLQWRAKEILTPEEWRRLYEIERQVFGG